MSTYISIRQRSGAGACITDVGVPCSSLGRGLFRPAKTPEIAWEEISPNPKVNGLNPCFSGTYSRMANHYPSESYGKSGRPQ